VTRVAVVLGAVSLAVTAAAGAGVPPIGARQPPSGARLPTCDANLFTPPGDREGACQSGDVTIATANRAHAVALKSLTVAVRQVQPIGRIKIGNGSIGPLDPAANTWIAVTIEVKNTSGHTATVRDEQLSLRVGGTRYPTQPEAGSSIPNSLTTASRKIGSSKTTTGTTVFEIPAVEVGMLTSAPSAVLFSGFGGDFGLNGIPGNTIGAIRLYQ
jgi:hypothetical protein